MIIRLHLGHKKDLEIKCDNFLELRKRDTAGISRETEEKRKRENQRQRETDRYRLRHRR